LNDERDANAYSFSFDNEKFTSFGLFGIVKAMVDLSRILKLETLRGRTQFQLKCRIFMEYLGLSKLTGDA
jgi:hypothetical protein